MLKIRRGSYANLASTAALVVALGGTSYAATMVTSHQIQDGTIQNRDIRTNTIDGSRVHDGSLGLGDLAPEAQSAAYSTYRDESVTIPTDGWLTVLTLTIPRTGDYVLDAKTVLNYGSGTAWTYITCVLSGGGDHDESEGYVDGGLPMTLPMQLVHHFNAGDTADVECVANNPGGAVKNTKITAISVDSLTNTHD